MIAEILTESVRLKLFGVDWPIVITHEVLIGLQRMTGVDVFGGAVDLRTPSAQTLKAMVYLTLRRAGCERSEGEVAAFIRPADVPRIHSAMVAAWVAAMPEPVAGTAVSEEKAGASNWIEAYALARMELWLPESEWLGLTPRILQALFRRRTDAMRREQILHGFTPSEEKQPQKDLTGEDVIAAMGGKIYLKG